jgi:lysophospholipase L1-like esterase
MTRYLSYLPLTLALAACATENVTTLPSETANHGLFASYVAIGNSISAGFQSGGIIDSTQQESFADLFAHAVGTRYAYPSINPPGCPPPIINFQTGELYDDSTSHSCGLRNPESVTAVLNNVAVPGAAVVDLTATTSANSNVLTTLILGGQTQIQKAIQANPTFVTVEIGNNDVLPAALSGDPVATAGVSPGITPLDSFTVQYARAMNQLTKAEPKVKGVLFGVFNVTLIPALFPIDSIFSDPVLAFEVNEAAGHTITYSPDCVNSGALLSIDVLPLMRAGTYPPAIGCSDTDLFTLDANKIAAFDLAITAFNAYIEAKADSMGFAFLDPNPLLVELRAAGQIYPVPNFASATEPFGPYVTLDGIHPSAAAHQIIFGALAAEVDSVYGVSITVPTAERVVRR